MVCRDTRAMQLRYNIHGTLWVILYLFFVLGPLFALLASSLPPARDFWTEFSIAIGYTGLAIMGLQFGHTARFRYVTAPRGEDVIYDFHRQLSLLRSAWSLRILYPFRRSARLIAAAPPFSEAPLASPLCLRLGFLSAHWL